MVVHGAQIDPDGSRRSVAVRSLKSNGLFSSAPSENDCEASGIRCFHGGVMAVLENTARVRIPGRSNIHAGPYIQAFHNKVHGHIQVVALFSSPLEILFVVLLLASFSVFDVQLQEVKSETGQIKSFKVLITVIPNPSSKQSL